MIESAPIVTNSSDFTSSSDVCCFSLLVLRQVRNNNSFFPCQVPLRPQTTLGNQRTPSTLQNDSSTSSLPFRNNLPSSWSLLHHTNYSCNLLAVRIWRTGRHLQAVRAPTSAPRKRSRKTDSDSCIDASDIPNQVLLRYTGFRGPSDSPRAGERPHIDDSE